MDAEGAAATALTIWQQASTPRGRTELWRRYRRAITIGAGVAGLGAVAVGSYWYWCRHVRWKEEQEVEQMRRDLELRRLRDEMERARAAEEAARADSQLQTHFESIQMIADTTTLPSVVPHLKTRLFSLIDLTSLTQALVASRGQGQGPQGQPLTNQQKMQIWEDLKILSFTRALGSMWATALLFLFVRIQLNILGRHVYIHTAAEEQGLHLEGRGPSSSVRLDLSCQHKFIAFSDYLPHFGLALLLENVQLAMRKALQTKSLKDKFSPVQLNTLLRDLKAEFESSRGATWHEYLLPAQNVLPDDLAVASSAADVAQTRPLGPFTPKEASANSSEEFGESTRSGALADAMAGGFQATSEADAARDLADSAAVGGKMEGGPKDPLVKSALGRGGAGERESDASEEAREAALDELMAETRMVLHSAEFRQALSAAVDAIADVAMDDLALSAFAQRPEPSSGVAPGVALAKLLPPVAAMAVSVLDLEESKYLHCLASIPEVSSFCALVYAGRMTYGIAPS